LNAGPRLAVDADANVPNLQDLSARLVEIDIGDQEIGAPQPGIRNIAERSRDLAPMFVRDDRDLPLAALIGVADDTLAGNDDGQANKQGTKGQQVFKFSPQGKVLLTLGKAGVSGRSPDTFNQPNDVITAPNGDIFVSDGHDGQQDNPPPNANARILKFTKDGKFIKEWGKLGSAPGEFRTPHSLAFDSRGRLFVADRGNHRIQIFDQDGKFLDQWRQFSRVSGLFIDRHDTLYAIDSETNGTRHPGWKTGIRVGSVKEDKVLAFIPPHQTDKYEGAAGEGVAVDFDGNVYAAEGPISRPTAGSGLTKYLKR